MTDTHSHFWPLYCVLLLLLLNSLVSGEAESSPDNGLGSQYHWLGWKSLDVSTEKPLMVIIHKPHCPACKSLKSWFSQSEDILRLSRRFSMVNFESGKEDAPKLEIDGRYVPRIYFLDSQGKVLEQVVNQAGNPNYKFFYYDETSVVQSMEAALKEIGESSNEPPEKEL